MRQTAGSSFIGSLICFLLCFFCVCQLFEVQSANEWKSIDVDSFFPESDDEIKAIVKCSTWSADGSRIICAARNAVFVSDFASGVVK